MCKNLNLWLLLQNDFTPKTFWILFQYLISSGLSVILTAWEVFDIEGLMKHYEFYTFGSDTVSLLTVISCAIRLPTYCFTDATLCRELKIMAIKIKTVFFGRAIRKRKKRSASLFLNPDSTVTPPLMFSKSSAKYVLTNKTRNRLESVKITATNPSVRNLFMELRIQKSYRELLS